MAASDDIQGIPLLDGTLLGVWNTIPTDGYTYSNPDRITQWTGMYADHQTGFHAIGELTGKDDLQDLQGHLALGGNLNFISRRYLGTIGSEYRGTYNPATRSLDGFSSGTYTAKPLKFVSDVQAAKLTGLLGGTDSLWTATQQSPAKLTFMGSIYPGSDRVLDIHAADQSGSQWSALFPGGMTHVFSIPYPDKNYIADQSHPIVRGLENTNYVGWNYVSHGYFTNLPVNANIILTDNAIPPNGGGIHLRRRYDASDPCRPSNGMVPPVGCLSKTPFRMPMTGRGEPCWSRTRIPGVTNPIKKPSPNWGSPMTFAPPSDFATKDLSQYSVIIIASDQTQQFF